MPKRNQNSGFQNFSLHQLSILLVAILVFVNIAICTSELSGINATSSSVSNSTGSNFDFNSSKIDNSVNNVEIPEGDLKLEQSQEVTNKTHTILNLTNSTNIVLKVVSNSCENPELNKTADSELTDNTNTSTSTQQPFRKDRHFGLNSLIFEEYLKTIDLNTIPGYRADDDFENYIPPDEVLREIPIYLSGFDYENRPVWVVEYGKYNYTKYATGGRKRPGLFHKYFRYVSYITLKSHAIKSTKEHPVNKHMIILDFEGLVPGHLLNPKALQLQLQHIRNYGRFAKRYYAKTVAINVNELVAPLLNLARPVLISLLDNVEIYGTSKSQWVPVLLKYCPKDQIPEWYGGSKAFRPIVVIG